jgi:hypothetical protein
MAVEAVSRIEVGEQHTGILLATTAMGALETLQGSEYGLVTRTLCCEAMLKTRSLQAQEMFSRAARYAAGVRDTIRDPELRALFARRRAVDFVLRNAGPPIGPSGETGAGAEASEGGAGPSPSG